MPILNKPIEHAERVRFQISLADAGLDPSTFGAAILVGEAVEDGKSEGNRVFVTHTIMGLGGVTRAFDAQPGGRWMAEVAESNASKPVVAVAFAMARPDPRGRTGEQAGDDARPGG